MGFMSLNYTLLQRFKQMPYALDYRQQNFTDSKVITMTN